MVSTTICRVAPQRRSQSDKSVAAPSSRGTKRKRAPAGPPSSAASRAVTRQMEETDTRQSSKPQPAEEEFTVSKENLPASGPATPTGTSVLNLSPGRKVTSGRRAANPLNPTQENSTAEASRPPQGVDETKDPSLKKKHKVFLAVYPKKGGRVLVDVSK